jgi:hypothetical protein
VQKGPMVTSCETTLKDIKTQGETHRKDIYMMATLNWKQCNAKKNNPKISDLKKTKTKCEKKRPNILLQELKPEPLTLKLKPKKIHKLVKSQQALEEKTWHKEIKVRKKNISTLERIIFA